MGGSQIQADTYIQPEQWQQRTCKKREMHTKRQTADRQAGSQPATYTESQTDKADTQAGSQPAWLATLNTHIHKHKPTDRKTVRNKNTDKHTYQDRHTHPCSET